jgi:MFS family permease
VTGAVLGACAAAAFIGVERRRSRPASPVPAMLPLGVFGSRQFTAVNVVTFVVYAALGGFFFLLVLQLQLVAGFSPLAAGLALLPATAAMLALSARAGWLAQRTGPRWLMTGGTALCAAGLLLATRIGPHTSYLADVLPSVLVFGLGLSLTVAPLTATVLASADVRHAGVASGVNNTVARAAGLLAVAGLPAVAGLSAASYHSPAAFSSGFRLAMVICAGLLIAGAALSALTIDSNVLRTSPGHPGVQPECRVNCPVGSPPAEPDQSPRLAAGR